MEGFDRGGNAIDRDVWASLYLPQGLGLLLDVRNRPLWGFGWRPDFVACLVAPWVDQTDRPAPLLGPVSPSVYVEDFPSLPQAWA